MPASGPPPAAAGVSTTPNPSSAICCRAAWCSPTWRDNDGNLERATVSWCRRDSSAPGKSSRNAARCTLSSNRPLRLRSRAPVVRPTAGPKAPGGRGNRFVLLRRDLQRGAVDLRHALGVARHVDHVILLRL